MAATQTKWATGKIKIENYQGQTMPVCYVADIEPAEKAKAAYIYFIYQRSRDRVDSAGLGEYNLYSNRYRLHAKGAIS